MVQLVDLRDDPFLGAPAILESSSEDFKIFVVLTSIFADVELDRSLKEAKFFNGSDFIHLVVLLKLSFHLLVVLEGQKIFENPEVVELAMAQKVFHKVGQVLLLFLDVLRVGFRAEQSYPLYIRQAHPWIYALQVLP